MTQEQINALCLKIYGETREFEPIAGLRDHGFGFEVLMGPPFKKPPCLFVGYQPGDWELTVEQARLAGYEDGWVTECCHYAVKDWRLAKVLRTIFGAKFLSACVGLNAIFVRAPNKKYYVRNVDLALRRQIRTFSREKNAQIAGAIEPERLFVIGFETMDILSNDAEVLIKGTNGHALLKTGTAFGKAALCVRHLTGARFRDGEREMVAENVRQWFKLS